MSKGKIVLVVEDEADLRMVIAEKLQELDYEVYQTGNGEEGFRIAEQVRPDVVISDIIMPKKDGNQLLKDLRATDFGKDIPFIVITARTAMKDYFEVIDVAAFFEKPFKLNELAGKVEEILAGRESGSKKQKGEHAPKKRPDEKGSDITVQEEALLKDSMFDVEKKADKVSILTEEKKVKGQWEGRSRIHQSAEKKILIYESELFVYKALENILYKSNCATELVLTRDECIEEAKRVMPNIILIRAKPGGIDTEEFAESLKEMPSLSVIPVIIYGDIGAIPDDKQTDEGEDAFIWNAEGVQVLQRIRALLGVE